MRPRLEPDVLQAHVCTVRVDETLAQELIAIAHERGTNASAIFRECMVLGAEAWRNEENTKLALHDFAGFEAVANHISPETADRLRIAAKRLGLTASQMIEVAIEIAVNAAEGTVGRDFL